MLLMSLRRTTQQRVQLYNDVMALELSPRCQITIRNLRQLLTSLATSKYDTVRSFQ